MGTMGRAGGNIVCKQTQLAIMLILFVNKPSWPYANFSVKWLNLILIYNYYIILNNGYLFKI